MSTNRSKNEIQESERKDKPLSVSGDFLMELMCAVHDRDACFRFRATGYSMTPAIKNNDVLTISPLRGVPPFQGEVVAFRHPRSDRLVLHRVYKSKNGIFTIKADNQKVVDAVINHDDILGVVTRIERGKKVPYLPDRFKHPLLTRHFSQIYLSLIRIKRFIRHLLRPVKKGLKRIIS